MTDVSSPSYRRDIDGLRAIAVLVVVLYHAGLTWLPGGFVGVDIFFVISGYLIGGQIYRERLNGHFSYLDFYARRLRRIMPALLVLLLTFMLVGAALLTPEEYRDLGKEAFASIFGLSNILFYLGNGYFAPAADMQPLLMTWSLGVEEQFYILFPILLLLVMRIRYVRVLPVIALLTALSFVASLWLVDANPQAAFYLLPTRAWELGVGAILAIRNVDGKPFRLAEKHPDALAGLAIILVIISAGFYQSEITFPGLFAAMPVVAGLLLLATSESVFNRQILSNKLMRFIGWISYSWYLWHWPIFYVYRLVGGEKGWDIVPAFILSFVMAVLSWRFVEQPLRKRVLTDRAAVMRYVVVMAVIAAPALLIYRSDGLTDRLPVQSRLMAEQAAAAHDNPCLTRAGVSEIGNLDRCMPALKAGQTERTLLIGDSHASALAPALSEQAAQRGHGFGELTKSSCFPFAEYVNLTPDQPDHPAQCLKYQRAVLAYIKAHPEITEIVVAGYWSNGPTLSVGGNSGRMVPLAVALDDVTATLRAIGRNVVLVVDVPEFDFDPYARYLGVDLPVRSWLSNENEMAGSSELSQVKPDPTVTLVRSIAASNSLGLIDPYAQLCDKAGCIYANNDALYYFDRQHITASGGRVILGMPAAPTKPVSWPSARQ